MPIISADKTRYDPPSRRPIELVDSKVPLVLVSRLEDFVFNDELESLDAYCLVNMSEFGWDFPFTETPIFGKNIDQYQKLFEGPEWEKLNEFVTRKPPLLTLQRELLQKDVTNTIKPIDYPFYGEIPPTQTKEEYYNRPINVFHYWGRSHEGRVKTHGDFWMESGNKSASICDNLYYINGFLNEEKNKNKWVSLNIPHYARVDLGHILSINGLSKMSLSMPGCGKKCFRHAEVSVNSVMMMESKTVNEIAWSFPWNGENCLVYYNDDPVAAIDNAISGYTHEVLYRIYCAGVENARNYQIGNYTKHLESVINSVV